MKNIWYIFIVFISLLIHFKVYAEPVFESNFSVAGENHTATGIAFNPSGTKMYVVGITSNASIGQYSLTTPFDLSSSITLDENVAIQDDIQRPQDIKFNGDGTKLIILATSNGRVEVYDLTTAYDVTTLTIGTPKQTNLGDNPRGFDFNNDGTKMFVLKASTLEEYVLTTPYDPSTKGVAKSISVDRGDSVHQGFGLSSDGKKMFVMKATIFGVMNNAQNLIDEYELTNPFDISKIKLNGTYNSSHSSNEQISGLVFNRSGSKLYYANFAAADEVRQFSLPCSYGIITCINPTSDGDDVGSVEAQSSATKKLIQHTSYPVLNRMEWLRRNKDSRNLTKQNLKLQFSNEILASLSNLFLPTGLTNTDSTLNQTSSTNWSYWSEGTISVGKIGDSISSSTKNINTTAITIGADKKIDKDRIHGFAFRFGSDDITVGNLGTALDMGALSLTVYETRPAGDDMFVDILLGASAIKTKLINNSGSVSTDGKRNGQQVFSSIKFRETFTKEKINFTPNIKLDLGLTTLSDYVEKGADGLNLRFGRQNIGTIVTSLGSTIDNTININNGVLKPNFQLEYNADISPSSRQVFEYASNGENYVIENINNSTHNFKGSLGFDLITDSGLLITSNYERSQNKGVGHTDAFYFAGSLTSRKDEKYTFGIDGIDTFNTKLDYKRSLNGFDITFSSNYKLMSLIPEYGANIELSSAF